MFIGNLYEGRGVVLYTKSFLNAEQVKFDTVFNESVWCHLKLQNRDSLLVGCVYRSPTASAENFQHLKSLLKKCKDKGYSHKLVMGDFNFKEINWCEMNTTVSEWHIASQFLECVRDSYLFQHVNTPTRYREGNVSSVLDLIFTNEEEMVTDLEFLPGLGKSDHLVLAFTLNCYTVEQQNQRKTEKLNFFKGDYNTVRDQLSLVDWNYELDGLNLLQSWSRFAEKIIDLIENYIPASKPGQSSNKYNPFITRSCLEAVKHKRKRWLKYIYCKTDQNFNLYKAARNDVTAKIRTARFNYEKTLASKIKTDNKIFWNYVRTKTKTKTVVAKLEMPNGKFTCNDQETANTLNDYFSTVFEKEPDEPLPVFEERPVTKHLENIDIAEKDVEKVLTALNPSKSQGPDMFHPKFLKETKDLIKYPLKIIFQKSLHESQLPPIWKKANISAIFKKGEKKKPENYRPISLTSVPCKLMEKILRDAIVEHMMENNLFSTMQHGFMKGRSCVTQLLEFLEDITQAIDDGNDVDVIYLDFCKAFDKVPHKRLLKKMYGYGIRGKIHSWVKEFLSEREQRVTVNGSQSSWKHITSGIPQGSVLGPVLFLVFINDLPEAIEVLMKLFADDAKIYAVVSNNRENLVQTSLNRAVNWARIWRMFFNTSKCHHLHVGKHDTGIRYTMTANNQEIELEKVESEKDLGVIIDQNLTFRAHITSKVNIANKNLGIIFRTFTYIDQEMFLNLYKSIVRPHLEYATPVWSPFYKKDKIIIENVQRRATKLVSSCKDLSYPERLRTLGLPTLEYRRERADLIQVYKILHDIDSVDKGKLFTTAQYRATRGHSYKLHKERSRLNLRAGTFSNRVINAWNKLPENVVNAPSLNAFKSSLNRHWHGHPYKFEAACYQTGHPVTEYRDASLKVYDLH